MSEKSGTDRLRRLTKRYYEGEKAKGEREKGREERRERKAEGEREWKGRKKRK